MTQGPLRTELAELPRVVASCREVKAGGESSILPEMVKVACIGDEFLN